MEDEDPTRPAIGFPLGLTLLFLVLFCMGGLFACCIYWDRLRAFCGASVDLDIEADFDSPYKSTPPHMNSKQDEGDSRLVIMPGDEVPKFIAMACPCEHLRIQMITVKVEKQSSFSGASVLD
ncbi:hypothetical protein Tsubulata_020083 [Turnera subulata]|uniref:Uncharacterized protein n=1 Tax=Turnera subulata TaxID=218843 RepID=A0A9Q0JCS2_9ROSI|nr:hypothetical protein Tsubulata_020083 [Turnera subulata]